MRRIIFSTIFLSALILQAPFAWAADPVSAPATPTSAAQNLNTSLKTNVKTAAESAGFSGASAESIAGNVIKAFLGILGVVFLILVIYAGFKWMMARGVEGEVEDARDLMIQATIGLGITLGAYAISTFVIKALETAFK